MLRSIIFLLAACAVASPSMARQTTDCPAGVVAPPAELADWSSREPATSATDPGALETATLVVGDAVDLALHPTPSVRYALSPERPGEPASHGGLATFVVDRAGVYRVALGAGAWVDVVRDGHALASVNHGHGPACSGIRKMVDFELTPGAYGLQVAGSATPAIAVVVARLP
jgi:hypothetical protein